MARRRCIREVNSATNFSRLLVAVEVDEAAEALSRRAAPKDASMESTSTHFHPPSFGFESVTRQKE